MPMKSEFVLRPYQPADAPRVVEIVNANAAQTVGFKQAVIDDVGKVRLTRYVPPNSKKVVIINAQNEIAGFAYCANTDQHIIISAGGAVHPHYWRHGIGALLVDWSEQQAAVLAQAAPPGIRSVLQTNLYADEKEAIRLFTGRGFVRVREWAHLVIELDTLPALPALTGNFSIRTMDLENDWDIVWPAMEDAFADHWGTISVPAVTDEIVEVESQAVEAPENETYSNSPGYCFVALAGKEVIGGVLCNARLVERSDTGRIGSLFVRLQYRRQGVARALMLSAFKAFWESGKKRIVADTDAESFTGAPKFYSSLGMRLFRREYLYEKEIRAGKEVRRLKM